MRQAVTMTEMHPKQHVSTMSCVSWSRSMGSLQQPPLQQEPMREKKDCGGGRGEKGTGEGGEREAHPVVAMAVAIQEAQ